MIESHNIYLVVFFDFHKNSLFLRQFAVEVLRSTLNSLIRQVRRTLERNSFGHDDSYLLWAIKFFLEFNRKSSFELALVRCVSISVFERSYEFINIDFRLSSEAMNTTTFHWVVARVQHHSDMLTSDKKNVRLWQRRLHIAVQVVFHIEFFSQEKTKIDCYST